MTRLLLLVEGATEETFVNKVLVPYLYEQGFLAVSARLMGHHRNRNRRGGVRNWPEVRKEIIRYLKEDQATYISMRRECPNFRQWIAEIESIAVDRGNLVN